MVLYFLPFLLGILFWCAQVLVCLLKPCLLVPLLSLPTTPIIIGVAFIKLDKDVKGRQKLAALARIVGELQRAEARRMRLGIAS
jgi:hypothetical protein